MPVSSLTVLKVAWDTPTFLLRAIVSVAPPLNDFAYVVAFFDAESRLTTETPDVGVTATADTLIPWRSVSALMLVANPEAMEFSVSPLWTV